MAVDVPQQILESSIIAPIPSHFINMFNHSNSFLKVSVISYLYYFFSSQKLLNHGGVETNLSPKKSHSYFSCCHWNVNTLIMVSTPSLSAGGWSLLPHPNFKKKGRRGPLTGSQLLEGGCWERGEWPSSGVCNFGTWIVCWIK